MTSPSIQASDNKNKAAKATPADEDRSLAQARDTLPVPPIECNCTPFSSGLFTWMRIFRFADSLMRQGC